MVKPEGESAMYFWLFLTKIGVNEYLGVTDLNHLNCIPEQFTVKAHPALFEGEGEGVSQKWGTVIPIYSWHTLSKRAQNTETAKASTLCVYIICAYNTDVKPVKAG